MRNVVTLIVATCSFLTGSFAVCASPSASSDTHKIELTDFRDYPYLNDCASGPVLVDLKDGQWPDPLPNGLNASYVRLEGVAYGWLTNETDDAAVVSLQCGGAGSEVLSAAYLYVIRAGKVAGVAAIHGGDRADGGIAGIDIAWGRILVTRYAVDHPGYAVCCPTHLVTTVYHWTGSKLVEDSSASQKFGLP